LQALIQKIEYFSSCQEAKIPANMGREGDFIKALTGATILA
jgi:hypothetical protein